ncbi:MAG: MgtC/SapB family protein [Vicinamibacterales bacterium]
MTEDLWAIAVAALGGAAVGVEREWSGHASGPEARFAGVRTFTMLGGLAGLAGRLWAAGAGVPAAILLAGAAAVIVAAYVAGSRRDVDGTTEVAALVVLAAGIAAGLGERRIASAIIAVTTLLLVEKSRLHAAVRHLDDREMRAAVRFAVMAVVVLPLLPEGPYGPLGGVRPRELWLIVLLFSAISFIGYLARRIAGPRYGYPVTGLLGGLVSSTSVTLAFARQSREQPAIGEPLASGVIAACTVLFVRILAAALILSPRMAVVLAAQFVLPFLVGAAVVVSRLRAGDADPALAPPAPGNPLQVRTALAMAILFQAVLVAVYAAREWYGGAGLLASGAVLGLTDTDALTFSMARSATTGTDAALAATAVTMGVLSNTLLKLVLALVLGDARFRRRVVPALGAMAAALAVVVAVSF